MSSSPEAEEDEDFLGGIFFLVLYFFLLSVFLKMKYLKVACLFFFLKKQITLENVQSL